MNNYVINADINIFDGTFYKSINFENGLNIISGENGTCKTQLLREMKNGKIKASDPNTRLNIVAYSPKRNSERKKIDKIFTEIRQHNKELPKYIEEAANFAFQDNTFVGYASFAELYFLSFDELRRDGKAIQEEKMIELAKDFNKIIKMIFDRYELVSIWDNIIGYPKITVRKEGKELQIEALSLGEQEILSLIFNIYTSRERNNVYLIDEPEIHLNWHLEEALFNFFDWFCSKYNKQIIVVTHSRVIFKNPFLKKTQFLFWKDGHIDIGKEIPEEQRRRISGEGIEIIKLGEFNKPTFFVEDQAHEDIIQIIAEVLGNPVLVSQCGNSQNVLSLFKLSRNEGKWAHCYFIIDGDNQGNPFPGEKQVIHLGKYSIENYLFDFPSAAYITNKNPEDIQGIIFDAITKKKDEILKKNKFFEFLFNRLEKGDIKEESLSQLDGSLIIYTYCLGINMEFKDYAIKYIKYLHDNNLLNKVFPDALISAIKA